MKKWLTALVAVVVVAVTIFMVITNGGKDLPVEISSYTFSEGSYIGSMSNSVTGATFAIALNINGVQATFVMNDPENPRMISGIGAYTGVNEFMIDAGYNDTIVIGINNAVNGIFDVWILETDLGGFISPVSLGEFENVVADQAALVEAIEAEAKTEVAN